MINGVQVKELDLIEDSRGWLTEILRKDWDFYEEPAQFYYTTARPGVVKAWHLHKKQTDHLCCIKGTVELGLHDPRDDSDTEGESMTVTMGERSPRVAKVPPEVYHGFKNVGGEIAIVTNAPTELYDYDDPDEYRLPPDTDEIDYDWALAPGVKHG